MAAGNAAVEAIAKLKLDSRGSQLLHLKSSEVPLATRDWYTWMDEVISNRMAPPFLLEQMQIPFGTLAYRDMPPRMRNYRGQKLQQHKSIYDAERDSYRTLKVETIDPSLVRDIRRDHDRLSPIDSNE